MGRRGFTTRQLHERAPQAAATPRATPIYLTAGFEFDEYEQAAAHFGQGEGYAYTRIGNPTIETVEHTLAALEGGSQALLLATGQAATSVALLALLESGQHVVSSAHIYEGTRGLLRVGRIDPLGERARELRMRGDHRPQPGGGQQHMDHHYAEGWHIREIDGINSIRRSCTSVDSKILADGCVHHGIKGTDSREDKFVQSSTLKLGCIVAYIK